MIRSLKNNILGLLLLLAGCTHKTALLPLPFINQPDFSPEWIRPSDSNYSTIHQIPNFSFTNQDNQTVSEKTVDGKIYVANFIFTRCGSICPKMTANMGILQNKFKEDKDIIFLSHSVTPEMDSVPALRRYANQKGIISGKWHFMTGNKEEIYRLAKQQYFAGDTIGYYQSGNEFLHTENFILVDKHRRIRGVYNGTLPIEMDRLIDDIGNLKQEDD